MDVMLADGSTIQCQDSPFAAGFDGEAFFSHDQKQVIKLYKNPDTWRTHGIDAILGRYNVVQGEPFWGQFYAWPIAKVVKPSLGISMRFVADQKPMAKFVIPKVRFGQLTPQEQGTWRGALAAAIKVSRAVKRLHQCGICHSDLSFSNIFINPATGEATIIDCDGLVVPGQLAPIVIGTRGFMAPEIMAGNARPSIDADRHALAVVIYRLLFLMDPFKGPKIHDPDPAVDDWLMYGKNALFIDHPKDHSNRPKISFPPLSLLGSELERLFLEAFVHYLHQPSQRPSASRWEEALINLYDQVVPCANPTCVFKSFALVGNKLPWQCPWCGTAFRHPSGQIPVLYSYAYNAKSSEWSRDYARRIIGYEQRTNEPRTLHAWHVNPAHLPSPTTDPRVQLASITYDQGSRRWYLNNYKLSGLRRGKNSNQSVAVASNTSIPLEKGDILVLGDRESSRALFVDFLPTP
jgi:DNA-binding helix-hairpin-helix protein with protein kinase domain